MSELLKLAWPSIAIAVGANWAAIALDVSGGDRILLIVSLCLVAFGGAGLGAMIVSSSSGSKERTR